MRPILFEIPLLGIPIPGFGFMAACALFLGLWQIHSHGRRLGLDRDRIDTLLFWTVLGVFLGGRILYFVVHPQELFRGPLYMAPIEFLSIWRGGLVFYGGLILGVATGAWKAWALGLPVLPILDVGLVAAFHGQVLGRMGCLLAGCDYGVALQVDDPAQAPWWALRVPDPLPPRSNLPMPEPGVPLFLVPTQVLMSLKALVIHLAGRWLIVRQRAWGETSCWLVLFYAILRSLVELVRGDTEARGYVVEGVLSTSQFLSIPLAMAAVAGLIFLRRRRADAPVFAAMEREAASR